MVLGMVSPAAASTSSIQYQAGSNAKTTSVKPTKIDSPRLKSSQVILKDEDTKKNITGANKSNESTKSSEAHMKAEKDAIKKLLDQLADLNKRSQL